MIFVCIPVLLIQPPLGISCTSFPSPWSEIRDNQKSQVNFVLRFQKWNGKIRSSCIMYLFIEFCSINSSMVYMQIEFLNICERLAYFLGNRNWIPVITTGKHCVIWFFKRKGMHSSPCQVFYSYSFKMGWALNILLWASSISILRLSSISLWISSSCLIKLSNWKGSGLVHGFGSGFGGTCSRY